jgi:hypothetical protein
MVGRTTLTNGQVWDTPCTCTRDVSVSNGRRRMPIAAARGHARRCRIPRGRRHDGWHRSGDLIMRSKGVRTAARHRRGGTDLTASGGRHVHAVKRCKGSACECELAFFRASCARGEHGPPGCDDGVAEWQQVSEKLPRYHSFLGFARAAKLRRFRSTAMVPAVMRERPFHSHP